MKFAAVLLVCVAGAFALSFPEFVQKFERNYAANSTEWAMREAIFNTNVAQIESHNKNPQHGYTKTINQFADLTSDEMKVYLGYNKPAGRTFKGLKQMEAPVFHTRVEDLPASVDWRKSGIVTPVKNQGGCGSCWAFASTETLESHAAASVSPPKQVILAPQQLVSCSTNPQKCGGTGGCEGSIAELAFDYVIKNGGMTLEKYIPYQARDTACTYSPTKTPPAATATGFVKLPENNYTALMNAIATIGPMAVNVEADTWSFYGGGIMAPSGCNERNTDIDHVVQLVGYGTDAGKDYWLVRNSWGPSWGEQGYIRLERTADGLPCNPDKTAGDGTACAPYPAEVTVCGTCGILYDSSYPVGAKLL